MVAHCIAFCLGVISLLIWPVAPSVVWLVVAAGGVVFFKRRFPFVLFLTTFLLGLAWASYQAQDWQQHRLAPALEKKHLWIRAQVVDFPQSYGDAQRYTVKPLCVYQYESLDAPCYVLPNFPQRILVTDPQRGKAHPIIPRLGDIYIWPVSLKRPHGTANWGGFDREGWYYQNNIGAVGYRIQRASLIPLQEVHPSFLTRFYQWRRHISEQLTQALPDQSSRALLPPLWVNDRSHLTQDYWQVLARTGTTHLLSISGLHISLMAAIFAGLAYGILRLSPRLPLVMPLKIPALVIGLLAATLYSLLAGFDYPTQRTLYMLIGVAAAFIFRRKTSLYEGLLISLTLILFLQPKAAGAMSLWLSFLSVWALVWVSHGYSMEKSISKTFGRTQWGLFWLMAPLLAFYFQQLSLIAPLVNLIAIAVFSCWILPCLLIAEALMLIYPPWAQSVLGFLSHTVAWSWQELVQISAWQWASVTIPPMSVGVLFMALLAALWWLLPLPLSLRVLAPALWLPWWLPRHIEIPEGQWQLSVLDVSQGLATVLRTQHHTLIYDTGNVFEDFSYAERVMTPYLQQAGVRRIDTLLVSHADQDHSGGAPFLLSRWPITRGLSWRYKPAEIKTPWYSCAAGQQWQWDKVKFEILYPGKDRIDERNVGCVLKVTSATGSSVLLTADISRAMEEELIDTRPQDLAANVLVVPHHGSATSSSTGFIQQVHPQLAIISAGYKNAFRHPRPEIVARYRDRTIPVLNTTWTGGIEVFSTNHSSVEWRTFRESHRRVWQNSPSD